MDQAIFVHIVAPYLIKSRAKSGYRNTIFRPTFEVRDFDNHHHNRHLTLPTTTPQLRCPLRQHSFSELDVWETQALPCIFLPFSWTHRTYRDPCSTP